MHKHIVEVPLTLSDAIIAIGFHIVVNIVSSPERLDVMIVLPQEMVFFATWLQKKTDAFNLAIRNTWSIIAFRLNMEGKPSYLANLQGAIRRRTE